VLESEKSRSWSAYSVPGTVGVPDHIGRYEAEALPTPKVNPPASKHRLQKDVKTPNLSFIVLLLFIW
jgi:hypothetical protein